jgi:hypothetical protein
MSLEDRFSALTRSSKGRGQTIRCLLVKAAGALLRPEEIADAQLDFAQLLRGDSVSATTCGYALSAQSSSREHQADGHLASLAISTTLLKPRRRTAVAQESGR